jgi:hypothetical protein
VSLPLPSSLYLGNPYTPEAAHLGVCFLLVQCGLGSPAGISGEYRCKADLDVKQIAKSFDAITDGLTAVFCFSKPGSSVEVAAPTYLGSHTASDAAPANLVSKSCQLLVRHRGGVTAAMGGEHGRSTHGHDTIHSHSLTTEICG